MSTLPASIKQKNIDKIGTSNRKLQDIAIVDKILTQTKQYFIVTDHPYINRCTLEQREYKSREIAVYKFFISPQGY